MAKPLALWKHAWEAAHEVYRSGMAAAKAQRQAGFHERTYEHAQGETEKASEHLLRQAEKVAEKAEGRAELWFVHMEEMMDRVEDEARNAREARWQRFHLAKNMVREARRAAKATGQQAPKVESAAASPQAHEAEPPAQKEDAAKEAPAQGEPIAERMAASPLFLFAQPPHG